jgi:hypothetical protein
MDLIGAVRPEQGYLPDRFPCPGKDQDSDSQSTYHLNVIGDKKRLCSIITVSCNKNVYGRIIALHRSRCRQRKPAGKVLQVNKSAGNGKIQILSGFSPPIYRLFQILFQNLILNNQPIPSRGASGDKEGKNAGICKTIQRDGPGTENDTGRTGPGIAP